MYKLVCEGLKNYSASFDDDENDVRLRNNLFLLLINDPVKYINQKENNTKAYQLLSSFLYSIRDCARCEQFLYELSAFDIEGANSFGGGDFSEQHRLLHMIYQYAYAT